MKNQIASVSGKNIKGRSFVHKLTPVTLIAGRNRRGKTTILDTIELAITSRTSSLRGANGKPVAQPREIFDALASSSSMSADVVYSDGTGAGISFTQNRGTVSTKRTDGGPELPPIMLDPTEYTNLSEPDRVKYIFARANLAHLTPAKLQQTVTANLKGIKLEENTPASEAVIADLVQYVAGRQLDVTPQDWVENLLVDAKAKLSAANANVKRMEQTQQGMTQVAGDENPAPADSEARLLDARKALESAHGDLTRLQTELETLKGLAASAGQAKALLESVSATDSRLKAVEARQGEIRAILAVPVDLTPSQDAYAAAQKAVNEQDLKVKAAEKLVADVEAEIAAAKELAAKQVDETAIKADISKLEATRDEAAKVPAAGIKPQYQQMPTGRPDTTAKAVCPTCGHAMVAPEILVAAEQWDKVQKANSDAHQSGLDAWNDAVANYNAAQSKVNELNAKIAALQNQLDGNAKAHDAWVNLPTLALKLTAAEQENEVAIEAYNKAAAALDAADGALNSLKIKQTGHNLLADEARSLETERQSLVATLESVSAARVEAAKLPALEAKITDIITAQEPALAQKSHAAREAVTAAESNVRRLTQQRAEARTRAKAKEESDKVRVEAQVLKEFCRLLADMQAEIVNAAIGPIVDRLNVMFKGVLDMPLCYKDGVIGTESPTGFYSMRSFSGAEKALAMCAISLALAAESPVKIVVLDELGRLDLINKLRLLKVTFDLQRAGAINQALIVDTSSNDYKQFSGEEMFSIIEL